MNVNRLIVLVLFLVLLVVVSRAILATTQAATPQLGLSAPTNAPAADTFDVQIVVSDTANLSAFEFDLNYDHTLAQVISMTLTTYLGQTTSCDPNSARCAVPRGPTEQSPRVTNIGANTVGKGSGPSGSGTLGAIHFKPTGKPGMLMLFVSSPLLSDTAGNPTTPTVQGAAIRLEALHQIFLPFVVQSNPKGAVDSRPYPVGR